MVAEKLTQLFERYIEAFTRYQLNDVASCYQLPCCLSTPEKMLVIESAEQFELEFTAIFQQLIQAKTAKISVLNASFALIDDNTVLACIDWQFISGENQVFADFSAFYHLVSDGTDYKIISVSSHELSQSKNLPNTLVLN